MRIRNVVVALVPALVMAIALGGGTSGGAPTVGDPTARSDDGSYVAGETVLDDRMGDLAIWSAAMHTIVHARIILPQSWFTDPARTYPTLYLLSGISADGQDWAKWTSMTPIESFMRDRDVLTVMPQDGDAGAYTNWVGTSRLFPGSPQWETLHTEELPQLMKRGFRASAVAALGGVSEAAIGVIDYPARHPGLYRAAASFSGLMDLQDPLSVLAVAAAELRALDNVFGPFGNPATSPAVWAEHNPMNQVAALAAGGVKVWISSGNGWPALQDKEWAPDGFVLESVAQDQNRAFAAKARAAGVDLVTDFYGAGDHNWPPWVRAFSNAWTTTLAPALGVS